MVNKLDGICAVVTSNGSDVAAITESWLSSSISNDLINIPRFVAVRRDRLDDQRGGSLCTYINAELNFTELSDLLDPAFETQRFLLKPKPPPRGTNFIILGIADHPPQNNDLAMINHLFKSLDSTLARFPNSGIVLMGDFNKFNPGPLISSFDLKEIVQSRGTNILDKICTSISTTTMMSKFFHRLDNQIIEVYLQSSKQGAAHQQPTYCIRRTSKSFNKRALVTELSMINWSNLYRMDSVIDQFAHFSHVLSLSMDNHLPLRKTINHPSDKPWLNEDIKDAISRGKWAWSSENTLTYNFYRNKVYKHCKSARKIYYENNK